MVSCRSNEVFEVPQQPRSHSLADTLRALRRRVIACTGLYAFAAVGVIAPCGALMLVRFAEWARALPAGAEPTLGRLLSDRPEVLMASVVGGLLGIVLAGCALAAWPLVMGRNNSPSKKVLLIIGGLPIALGVAGALLTVASAGTTSLVAAPLMIGATFALVPFVVGLMAIGLLQLALNFHGQSPQACQAAELPPEVAEYFDRFDSAAAAVGLEPAGNFCFVPKRNRFSRVWIAPNGAYFVDATLVTMDATTIRALSVSSATEDGHHFATTDLAEPKLPCDEGFNHTRQIAGGSLAELIERHIETIGDWAERTGSRPLVFAADDQHALFEYGLAAQLQHETNELFWIGNPYRNQPLPRLPGRVWQGDESLEDARRPARC